MMQVLTAKTTEAYVLAEDAELSADVQRREEKNVRTKAVRVKAAKARAAACVKDIQTVLGDGQLSEGVAVSNVKRQLDQLKKERRHTSKKHKNNDPTGT